MNFHPISCHHNPTSMPVESRNTYVPGPKGLPGVVLLILRIAWGRTAHPKNSKFPFLSCCFEVTNVPRALGTIMQDSNYHNFDILETTPNTSIFMSSAMSGCRHIA